MCKPKSPMPHVIREEHLDDICAGCKKHPGKDISLERHHHKIYEIITCINCGYENFKSKKELEYTDKWEMFHKG